MKTSSCFGILWAAIVNAHPGHVPQRDSELSYEAGYRPTRDSNTSPVPRGILGSTVNNPSGGLVKRQCAPGDLYCVAVNFCCISGYSCCGYDFCCPPGYACPVSGPCYQDDVYTSTYTSYYVVTSNTVSTLSSDSTSWDVITTTSWSTDTTHIQGGTSTETSWVTVTSTLNQKRFAPAAPTPAVTAAPEPPTFVEGQTPAAELLRRALVDIGLLTKRAVTSYVTVVSTSISYRTSYTTVEGVVTSTSTTEVEATTTSTIVDDAAGTSTVTATTTYYERAGSKQTPPSNSDSNSNSNSNSGSNSNPNQDQNQHTPQPSQGASQPSQGASQGGAGGGNQSPPSSSNSISKAGIIGIAVSIGCSVLGLIFAVGFKIWNYRRQQSEAGASPAAKQGGQIWSS